MKQLLNNLTMNKIQRYTFIFCLLTCCSVMSAAEYELVMPPTGTPEQDWVMTYDKYQSVIYPDSTELTNLKRNVTVCMSGNDIYIKGVFRTFPNGWVKCSIIDDDKTLDFEPVQLMSYLDNCPIYVKTGFMHRSVKLKPNATWQYNACNFIYTYYTRNQYNPIAYRYYYRLSEDSRHITCIDANPTEEDCNAFWYGVDVAFTRLVQSTPDGKLNEGEYPDADFPINLRFDKAGTE